jgi:hypothetical protein
VGKALTNDICCRFKGIPIMTLFLHALIVLAFEHLII